MLVLGKHMLAKYKSHVVKMGDNLARNAIAKNNYCVIVTLFWDYLCVAHVGGNAKLTQDGVHLM
jgi:hypothetical protein